MYVHKITKQRLGIWWLSPTKRTTSSSNNRLFCWSTWLEFLSINKKFIRIICQTKAVLQTFVFCYCHWICCWILECTSNLTNHSPFLSHISYNIRLNEGEATSGHNARWQHAIISLQSNEVPSFLVLTEINAGSLTDPGKKTMRDLSKTPKVKNRPLLSCKDHGH